MRVAQCRQCISSECVEACPTGALHIDSDNGNVKTVDAEKCDGCKLCIEACAYQPHRLIWNREEEHVLTCDLCLNTPFWNEKGGPDGMQACVVICPVGALQFTKEMPEQEGDAGYEVNLRRKGWAMIGFPTN
jgi:protein NrfC